MIGGAPHLVLVTCSSILSASAASPVPRPLVAVVPLTAAAEHHDETALIEAGIEQGVEGTATVRALGAREFARLRERALGVGIVCEPADPQCAARVGAFGGVDFALVPRVRWGATDDDAAPATLTIVLIDCATGAEVRASSATLLGASASWVPTTLALTRAALGTAPAPTPPAADPARPANGARVDVAARPAHTPAPAPARPWAAVGVTVLGTGALVAAGGAVGAWLVAPSEDRRAEVTARQYNDAVLMGRALMVVSAAGVAVAGAGATLWLLDVDDPS